MNDDDRTASLITPAVLARMKTQTTASPAVWLDHLAADAGQLPVMRLAELRRALTAQAELRDAGALAEQAGALDTALQQMDFGLLQARGWWARATGRGRDAGAEFTRQFEHAGQAAMRLEAQMAALQKNHQSRAAAMERGLVEMELEGRSLAQTVEQGGKWLQDMRAQLQRGADAATDAAARQQVQEDTARCDILVARLTALRGVGEAADLARRQAQDAWARRVALLPALPALTKALAHWRDQLAGLSAADGAGAALERPLKAHRQLGDQVRQLADQCTPLLAQNAALAGSLQALGLQLQAAGQE
ncbi:hypothetical protein [Variovorax terrae]|uniref:Uncharacterized protein n=1 Tax=Variovorax terrae TaxID=2923278 RepID=A0A9X1W2G4_9BURK|nr:hypothetical protein [Variovorax terrae]MCJ0764858.1 hypothetical protein [Variovorax terrae]